ncbi:hypothetical protein CHGG_03604 [Chaetomium globosum CBS 148.51]|uniref:Uncharacterized protein n=1 Tax=Chaetomium globosum (strain ATCC 6205 / CBS 148.51 / DSM 1962 / NBRC 6347 / NRRL 1970) TaxID=306901 RepID=Q2H850_CHAGB|nr:uncharacterized protein CHGG_03604 [Chaetomium globosum CBS 148.51]EAQ91669.1 hypothetical protein CHGG_03604 [Chaetomium globosum CBS 148.51]
MAVLDFPGKREELNKNQQSTLRHEFYPPLFLLDSLNQVCPRGSRRTPSDGPQNEHQSPEERFQTLVNKLAQICDFEPKGNTVSALAVIIHNGRLCYVLASNRRGTGAMKNARAGLQAVLNILKDSVEKRTDDSDEVMEKRLMREILTWNMVRARSYLTSLEKELQKCIAKCDTTEQGNNAKQELQRLAAFLPKVKDGQKSDSYIESTMRLIAAIQTSRESQLPTWRYIEAGAVADDTMAKGGCWSALQHSAGRLLSYRYAAHSLVNARHIWAETDLFRDFDIETVRSSLPNAKAGTLSPETVEDILNRAPNATKAQRKAYRQHAAELQVYDLNAKLAEQWDRKLEPIVHAEMLLHEWLSRTEGGTQSYRFFNGWQYIGTSKPVCKLCTDYFDIISTPVRFRPGHPNTYLNWRLPDIYVEGKDPVAVDRAKAEWNSNLDEMKKRIYVALLRVLQDKVSGKKPNDSNTYSERITTGDADYISKWLGKIQINN